jgi:alkyldihydroxyacetonephosphate synthase
MARRSSPQTGAPGALCVTIRAVDPIDSLASRLPRGAVTTDPQILRERAIDSWTLGLLRQVRGDELLEPAAVVFPTSTEDVATVLSWAAPMRIPVITRGGGSGVCGGASGAKASVVLDMTRMDKITDVDLASRAVHVQAGVRGDQLEDVLAADGLTVGHYPQSLAMSTVGGWIAASSAGQASTGFGAIEDVLLGLTAVLPTGRVLRCRPVPRSAAGPDLRRLLVGSEGTFAVVTEATLACRPRPAGWQWLAFGFPTFDALADGLRDAVRAETGAVICRGYDPTDAQLSFGPLGHSSGCVGLLGFPVGLPGLDARMAVAAEVLGEAGNQLDSSYGDHWWRHRNDAVDTYARIMGPARAFGSGVVVDTMEVAGLWSVVPRLYAGVRTALAANAQAVGCHLSHLYPSGSALYFTFLISGADDRDAETRYLAAWDQAVRSCAAMGGTMTHHHGVGRLKSAYLPGEIGETGVQVLRRIKAAFDPDGIMNPRVLLP